MVTRSQKRISKPLMDRIDMHVQVQRVEFAKLRDMCQVESSAEARTYVGNAASLTVSVQAMQPKIEKH